MAKCEKERAFRTREEYISSVLDDHRQDGKLVHYEYARGPSYWTGAYGKRGELVMGRGDREGIFLVLEDEDGGLRFGWSMRHSTQEEKPFCKYEGIYLALLRSQGKLQGCLPDRQAENYARFMQRHEERQKMKKDPNALIESA